MWKLWTHKVKIANIFQNREIFWKNGTKSGDFGFFTRSIYLLNPPLLYIPTKSINNHAINFKSSKLHSILQSISYCLEIMKLGIAWCLSRLSVHRIHHLFPNIIYSPISISECQEISPLSIQIINNSLIRSTISF